MRYCAALSFGVLLGLSVRATTLQQLTLDDMIARSTAIVRCTVQPATVEKRGPVIYTHFRVTATEQWKGMPPVLDISVPGGSASGVTQTYSGAPALVLGQQYVLFIWTSKSGLSQVIGLSQGVFTISPDTAGQPVVTRAASTARILDPSGQPVADLPFQMTLADFRARVAQVLAGKAAGQ